MEKTRIPELDKQATRVALGAWAIGGWKWGGTDEKASVQTIHAALEKGVNLIDTAPVYGFGTSEEILGKALAEYGGRENLILATKAGLAWDANKKAVWRDSSPERLRKEVEDSLRRLQTDVIDIYQIHWPDPTVDLQTTAETLARLKQEGKIRVAGVSNFSPEQMAEFQKGTTLGVCQPPFNIFERAAENEVIPYCSSNGIATLTYGALCRGLLSGKMSRERIFYGDDLRNIDPKFQQPRYEQYLAAAGRLQDFARKRHGKDILHLAVRFVLDRGASVALWGGRRPSDMDPLPQISGWELTDSDFREIDAILQETVTDPVGPEFMAPPAKK
ncbi:MAG: aldo/keto reductase [Desulfosalsimonadaceae bacterium]